MSTSVLYRAIGMRGYQHLAAWDEDGAFKLRARPPKSGLKCPGCGSRDVIRRGTVDRLLHAPPIGLRATVLFVQTPRGQCRRCCRVRTVTLSNAVPGTNHTKSFARLVIDRRKMMTIQDITRYLAVSTRMVRDIDKRYLQRRFGKLRLRNLRAIAIDEISLRKGHRYATIVMDLDSGAIVHVGQGKGEKSLKRFWKRLRGSKVRICAAATDMSSAYYAAVRKHLPHAKLVFDRFHIVKLFNEKLTQLRRELYREAVTMLDKAVLKGIRWLLLKNPDNLDEDRNEHRRLQDALKLNQPLATA